ncbi:MAG: ATP-binding protein [Candidatus Colwellbacteria bacterium]|nr:ATP-binding protein [Candidatus Colwellbacteria bacterium]
MAEIQKARTQDLIHIKSIKDGVVTMKSGGLRKIIMVDGINFDLKSEEEQRSIIGAYQNLLNSLDFSLQTIIHSRKLNIEGYLDSLKQREAEETNQLIKTQTGEYISFIESFVGENAIMQKSFFLVVPYEPTTIVPKGIEGAASGISRIFSIKKKTGERPLEEQSSQDAPNPAHLEQLHQRTEQIINGLRQIGLRAVPLEDPELLELYFNAYNPVAVEKRGQEIGKQAAEGVPEAENIIAPQALEVGPQYLKIGDKFSKTLFIFNYPRYLTTGWLSPVINMPELMDVSIFVHPTQTGTVLRNLRKKVAQLESQLQEEREKGLVRNPTLETAFADAEQLRDSLLQSQEKFFDTAVYITIYADSEKELKKIEGEIVEMLDAKLINVRSAQFEQLKGLHSTTPIAEDQLGIHTPLNSGPASSFFPFVSANLTSDEGVMHGVNRHNNTLIIFDRFSLENANMVIFAKAGAGKSYAAKLEILRSLMLGTDVIVIDPENEYERMADEIGGSVFKIALDSDSHINPFEIPIVPEDETPSEVLKSHIVNLTGLLKLMLGKIEPHEEALLDQTISAVYASRDITPDKDFKDKTPPLLEDLESVLRNTDGGKQMAERLYRFTKGSYSGFTNRPTDVNINNRLIVFSIRDLEEELRPVAMYIILNFVWSLVRAELKKRMMVIDEAWLLMKNEDSASFLFGLAKRSRKYYLGLTTITQDVEDFLNSPYGRPIITNSSLQLLLKQAPASIDVVSKAFALTEVEKNYLLEADIGQGLFIAGLKHAAIQVVPSYFEDQLITTNPEEILEQR